MKRAVFYGRYSSDRQTEQSIEGQRRVCEEFAKAEQIQIVGEYIDRATSGTSTEHREQFQKMLKDSKNGGWDYVLVYKLDRFARSRYDSAISKQQLKKEHFENYFRWLALRLEHIEDRQTFFHTVIHKVLVYPEKAVIILNMTDEMADPPKREQVEAFMSNVGEVSL
ncbi:MAG: recombinase family protein [Ruminococcus sp.]|nr:recombinase family protein [Ruminococcus sp.]